MFWLFSCWSRILEAPYVLTSGVGDAQGISPSPDRTLMVASDRGVFEVDGDGKIHQVAAGPAKAVGSHRDALYVLRQDRIDWRLNGKWNQTPFPGAIDLIAVCDDAVLVADPSGIQWWHPPTSERRPWLAQSGIVSIAHSPTICTEVLVTLPDRVLAATPERTRILAQGLQAARVAGADRQHRLWVIADEDPALYQIDNGQPVRHARYLGDAQDLVFGFGDLYDPLNVYLANASGTIDYVRVSSQAPGSALALPAE